MICLLQHVQMYVYIYVCVKIMLLYSIGLIALTQMFINYVAQALTADLYPATVAGYSKTLGFNPSGLTIQVNGYSDENVMERYLNVLLQGQCILASVKALLYVLCMYKYIQYVSIQSRVVLYGWVP